MINSVDVYYFLKTFRIYCFCSIVVCGAAMTQWLSLRPGCLTHKFVDDTTMSEILNKSVASNMQSLVDELVQQATETGMIVNDRKTAIVLPQAA